MRHRTARAATAGGRVTGVALVLAALAGLGCETFAVEALRSMPPWQCIRANEPITLYADLDESGETPRVADPVGVLEARARARVLAHLEHPPGSGWETHYRVQSLNGELTGWFEVGSATFEGGDEIDCR